LVRDRRITNSDRTHTATRRQAKIHAFADEDSPSKCMPPSANLTANGWDNNTTSPSPFHRPGNGRTDVQNQRVQRGRLANRVTYPTLRLL
jgi:hypothetical protein